MKINQWALLLLAMVAVGNLQGNAKHKILYFVAPAYLFDPNFHDRDDCNLPQIRLREAAEILGYTVKTVSNINKLDDVAAIIFFNLPRDVNQWLPYLSQYPREKLILYLWEPPIHEYLGNNFSYQKFFGKVFSLWSQYVDNKHVLQHFYVQPRLDMINDLVSFEQKKLCTMIVGHKFGGGADGLYDERLKAIEFFEQLHDNVFDLYGSGWPARKSYKGAIPHKKDYLKKYRFSLCYENSHSFKGYVTEKIFDCFFAGCVPIYWGAPDIERYVPKNCFIDRRNFKTLDQLYVFFKKYG